MLISSPINFTISTSNYALLRVVVKNRLFKECNLDIESLNSLVVWPKNRRIAILSNVEWVKQIFQAYFMVHVIKCISDIRLFIVDYSRTLQLDVLENIEKRYNVNLLEKTVYLSRLPFKMGNNISLHIHNPSSSEKSIRNFKNMVHKIQSAKFIIVTDAKPSLALRNIKGYLRMYCKRISPRIFELKSFSDKILLKISSNEIYDYLDELPWYMKKAFNSLQQASAEFGSFTTSDAVTIITKTTGFSRQNASRILRKLAALGLVRVEKGMVIVL